MIAESKRRDFAAAMAVPNMEDAFPNLAKRVDLPARKEAANEGGRTRRRSTAGECVRRVSRRTPCSPDVERAIKRVSVQGERASEVVRFL